MAKKKNIELAVLPVVCTDPEERKVYLVRKGTQSAETYNLEAHLADGWELVK